MTDLTGKFGALETTTAARHTEIMDALNTIAFALGAPPTTPTANLQDVVTALTASNLLLTSIDTKLGYIFNTVDTMNNNASLNAQRLMTFLFQTTCACDSDLPLLPPILDVTPTIFEEDVLCQRIQYFLDLFRSFVINAGSYLATHGSITSFQVNNILSLVLLDRGIASSELNSISSSTRDTISAFMNGSGTPSAVNADLFYAIHSTSLLADMRQALYNATNAADGYEAARSAMSTYESVPGAGISNMFFSSWANVMYGAVPEVDLTGYDGSICAPPTSTTCVDIASVHGTTSLGFSGQVIAYAIPSAALVSSFNDGSSIVATNPDFYVAGDYAGWTMRLVSGDHVAVQYHPTVGPSGVEGWTSPSISNPYTFPSTAAVVIYSPDGGEITVRLCPPGVDNPA